MALNANELKNEILNALENKGFNTSVHGDDGTNWIIPFVEVIATTIINHFTVNAEVTAGDSGLDRDGGIRPSGKII